MKILMFSGDPNVADKNSDTARRMVDYGNLVDRLDIILVIKKKNQNINLSQNVSVYTASGVVLRFFKAFFLGLKLLKKQRYNLMSAQDIEHSVIACLLSFFYKTPWQMQVHTDIFSPYFVEHSMFNRLRVIFTKFLIPRANCIRVVSERIKKSIEARFKNHDLRITVLPIFVDVEKIKSVPITIDLRKKYPEYDKIILMASRLTREKNIGMAIGAIQEVIKQFPKALLLIVGDGSEKEGLQATSYKLQANIVFEDALPFDTLISYYKTADLFLLTSNYEGYGRTLIEAAMAGCPIVSTDVGITRELEDISIIPVDDQQALVVAIVKKLRGFRVFPEYPSMLVHSEYLVFYKKSWEMCL